MEYNLIGPVTASATFLGIWTGHVLVREIERRSASLLLPSACFAFIGLSLAISSFLFDSPLISTTLGILGMTALWDSIEFLRQQKRVTRGWAPANPSNPRHARLLEKYPSATTIDLLKRDPIGRAVNKEEAVKLVSTKGNSR